MIIKIKTAKKKIIINHNDHRNPQYPGVCAATVCGLANS